VNVRGPLFDSSVVMAQAAMRGVGVALAPHALFRRELASGQLVRPFAIEADTDGYWLTWLKSRSLSPAMQAFRDWLALLYPDQVLAANA
jgi:LysR family transcriptional regulator of beta-lactamase